MKPRTHLRFRDGGDLRPRAGDQDERETMTDRTTERLRACYTGVVHDVMRAMGLRDFTFPPELRPLLADRTLAGPAFTIDGKVDPDADPHETLLAWTGLLSRAKAGHIWVSQPNDRVVAHM